MDYQTRSFIECCKDKLKLKPSMAYIDGLFVPKNMEIKCKAFVKGDEKIISISAASIVAKATRDLFMIKLGKKFPKYIFEHSGLQKEQKVRKPTLKEGPQIYLVISGGTGVTSVLLSLSNLMVL